MEDVQMANPTYFSFWYRFVLFQKEIQIIAIAVFKNCTKPERPSKNTSVLSVAMMYKTCYRERFKQNFLILNQLPLAKLTRSQLFSVIGNNYDYIQRHLIESKHNNNYITVDELIAREFSRLRPGTTILLPPHFNKWCNVTSHNKQVFVLSRLLQLNLHTGQCMYFLAKKASTYECCPISKTS